MSIFFLDEDQRVTFKDIGDRGEILRHARAAGADAVRAGERDILTEMDGDDG